MLDVRSVLITSLLTGIATAIVYLVLWKSLRHRLSGVGFWAASYALQAVALFLVAFRGVITDWLTVIVANLCSVGGIFLLTHGLILFLGKPIKLIRFWVTLVFYTIWMVYFTFIEPSVSWRVVASAGIILMLASISGWRMLTLADVDMRRLARSAGISLVALALNQIARIFTAVSSPSTDFMQSASVDALLLALNHVFIIALAFSIILLSNGRLILELRRNELNLQEQARQLRASEAQIKQYSDGLEAKVAERTQQLETAQAELIQQERMAVLGRLASSVGHELRNPLGNINNATYLLNLLLQDADEKVKEYLTMIHQEVHTADHIITDLLDYSRIKSFMPEMISVKELIRRALEKYPAPPGITIRQEHEPELPNVYADPQHVIRILGNLLNNAYQAMPDGGTVFLRGRIFDDNMHPQVIIEVEDTGHGIPPQNMERLFEPLFTTKPKGVGLGLAVAKKLAEANSGKISVTSVVDKGSLFSLFLPIAEVAL